VTARRSIFAALLLASSALPVRSDEPPQPLTAREWVTLRAMSRMGAYAEVCAQRMQDTRPAWERALASIRATVTRVTEQQLATRRFAGLDTVSVAAGRSAELRNGVEAARTKLVARLETQDPDAHCLQYLRNAQGFDDEALKPIVVDALASFRAVFPAASSGRPP